MVSISKKIDSQQTSALTDHADTLSHQQLVSQIQELVETRNLATDDEIYGITGTIERIAKITEHLNNVSSVIPKALQDVWEQERQLRQSEVSDGILHQQQTEFIDKIAIENKRLQALSKKAIARSGNNINTKLQGLCWSLGGCLVGMGLSWLVIFPRQLSLARGSDGAMLEWLNTSDGRLMHKSFRSGNSSVKACIRKGIKKTGKTVCMLEIK